MTGARPARSGIGRDSAMRVLVTAGAAGIGRAMAEAFLDEGARVAICDVDEAALGTFAAAHPDAVAVRASVVEEAELDATFDAVERRWGGLDVVCANAGTSGPAGPVEEIPIGGWRECISVNLDGSFLTARRAARGLKEQGSGLLLFTASSAGLLGYPLRTPYASAKWAVIGLMKSLAMELGPHGVRVNALCPGAVEGPRMERVVATEAAARGTSVEVARQVYAEGISMRTWVTAQDVASMAVFLASPAGAKVSGQAISIDGHTERLT